MSSQSQQYPYGRRIHITQNVTAQPTYDIRPLRREDFLNPVEGDEFNHGEIHATAVERLATRLRHHFRYNPATSVLRGPIIRWGAAGLAAPMPDIAIVNDLPDPARHITTLDVPALQASVRAIFEVTSPLFADYDLHEKVDLYQRAGVPEYWVIDTGLRPEQAELVYCIHGWRLVQNTYAPIEGDAQGRLHSVVCRIWLRVTDDRQAIEIGDSRTNQPITPGEDDAARPDSARAEANARAQSIADQLKF